MPNKPLRVCRHPGCGKLVIGTYCGEHQPKKDHWGRESATKRGYGYKWRKSRAEYLARHHWCAECIKDGRLTEATEVDHIRPHKGDKHLFWDKGNWQPLCKSCHSRKTAKEDGGFHNC